MGLAEVLTIVFVVLKLTHEITWSWWLVLLPEEIVGVFYVIFFILAACGATSVHKRVKRW